MNATTGVTNIGPTTGSCCKPSSGAGAAIATGGWAAGVVTADVVTVDVGTVLAFASVFDLLDSCRAAATISNGSAGSAGAFGFCAASAVSAVSVVSAVFGPEATGTLVVFFFFFGVGSAAGLISTDSVA